MNRESQPTSARCEFCGTASDGAERPTALPQHAAVIVACGSCGTAFVMLGRN